MTATSFGESGGQMQRGPAFGVTRADVRATVEQGLKNGRICVRGNSQKQGCVAEVVPGLDVRAVIEQRFVGWAASLA